MTYVVNESCIRCKTMDCVEVCPVDCFYEGENMLVTRTNASIAGWASRSAFRKSYPDVMMVQPRQDWDSYNDPGLLHCPT